MYEQHAWAAGAWRDVFADLVQGQLQQLFLTLLRRIVDASGVHVEARDSPFIPGFLVTHCASVLTNIRTQHKGVCYTTSMSCILKLVILSIFPTDRQESGLTVVRTKPQAGILPFPCC